MVSKAHRFLTLSLLACTLGSTCVLRTAHASAGNEANVDATSLTNLESQVATAEPRDRCYLYTELLHNWTELAGREIAAGNDDAARFAMEHADADAAKLRSTIAHDSKRLKNAELILQHSVRRLSDMMLVTSMDQREALKTVLRHVSSVHDELLAAVFAH